jgi:hypothetical protein
MSAYRKFSDVVRSEERALAPPKAAKAAKAAKIGVKGAGTLGGLDSLGGAEPEIRNSKPSVSPLDRALATWGEDEEERAAIVEHGSKIPSAWAEGFARLDPDRPPSDVPLRRWQRFVGDYLVGKPIAIC